MVRLRRHTRGREGHGKIREIPYVSRIKPAPSSLGQQLLIKQATTDKHRK